MQESWENSPIVFVVVPVCFMRFALFGCVHHLEYCVSFLSTDAFVRVWHGPKIQSVCSRAPAKVLVASRDLLEGTLPRRVNSRLQVLHVSEAAVRSGGEILFGVFQKKHLGLVCESGTSLLLEFIWICLNGFWCSPLQSKGDMVSKAPCVSVCVKGRPSP